jgi:tetratricopeptide (TPR) repeat protein
MLEVRRKTNSPGRLINMDTDRNLLFGVLAMQVDLIDAARFAEVCTAWALQKTVPLSDHLVARGWITLEEKTEVDRLVDRRLRRHAGDTQRSLAASLDSDAWRMLAHVADADVQATLAASGETAGPRSLTSTVDQLLEDRGRYTLIQFHDHGGIGRVWRARDNVLGREVALKELLPEKARDGAHRARFLNEGRVTSQLQHPGIVPVYDQAEDATGNPCFTMRFVKGRTLRDTARDNHKKRLKGEAGALELRELLGAFVGVCNALAYAHAHGVLHRDLKGANVILGDYGEVMVLDWGLAKVRGAPGDEESSFVQSEGFSADPDLGTKSDQILGTAGYMSPEAADARHELVDERTDVYGAGAVLYEILAGRAPFVGKTVGEILRKVRIETPARPRSSWPQCPRALEEVCLKALSKERDDRYSTIGALAAEVRRWLADEPVDVWPDSVLERAGRLARRHRQAVASGIVFLATFLVAALAGAWQLERHGRQLEAALHRSETNFRLARSAVDETTTRVAEGPLAYLPQAESVRTEVIDTASRFYQEFLRARPRDPSVRDRAAWLFRVAGNTHRLYGEFDVARTLYGQSLELREALLRERGESPPDRAELALIRLDLGELLHRNGDPRGALDQYGRALTVVEALHRENSRHTGYTQVLAMTLSAVAGALRESGDVERAAALHRRAYELALTSMTTGRSTDLDHLVLALVLLDSAESDLLQGDAAQAEQALSDTIWECRRLLDRNRFDNNARFFLARACLCLRRLYLSESQRADEAAGAFDEARGLLEQLRSDFPRIPRYRQLLEEALAQADSPTR